MDLKPITYFQFKEGKTLTLALTYFLTVSFWKKKIENVLELIRRQMERKKRKQKHKISVFSSKAFSITRRTRMITLMQTKKLDNPNYSLIRI